MKQFFDQEVSQLIEHEHVRQQTGINLIASESIMPDAVRVVMASCLAQKYAEGYPGRRFYAGCQYIDDIERLAIERAKKLFGAQHANVQSHAGAQANMAAYIAVLHPGDCVLAMDFAAGGHLTHGHPKALAGQLYNFIFYGVDRECELIDYDQLAQLAQKYKPKLVIAGASAYSRVIDWQKIATIAHENGALFMVDMAHVAGLVAAELYPNPIAHADIVTSTTHKTLCGPRGAFILCTQELAERIDKAVMPGVQGGPFMHAIAAKAIAFNIAQKKEFKVYQKLVIANAQRLAQEFIQCGYRIVSRGTDTHLFIIDLSSKNLSGRQAEELLAQNNIYVNRNVIPFDQRPPVVASGIRLGTPFITAQGKTLEDMVLIAERIDQVLRV